MLKKLIFGIFLLFIFCLPFSKSIADNNEAEIIPETETGADILSMPEIVPIISAEELIALNKKSLFDASDSILLPEESNAEFFWNFGDGTPEQIGREIIHDFQQTGAYTITLKIKQNDHEKTTKKDVFVYSKKAVLITDSALFNKQTINQISQQNIAIADQAARQGVGLEIITIENKDTAFLTEEEVVQKITKKIDYFHEADFLIFYTKSSLELQGFTRFWQNLPSAEKINFTDKLLVKITDENLPITAKITQQTFNVIKPPFILVTRKEAINPIFEIKNNNLLIQELNARAIEYKIVDERSERSKIFILSTIITSFIAQGIPQNAIYLILVFPFAAFIIAFARQIIGLSTFGVYTPLMLIISFLLLGIKLGLSILLIVIAASYILRKIFNRIELLYIPRVSLMFSFISLSFLGTIWFVLKFSTPVVITLAIFPMLVMSTMSEKFVSSQSEEGFSKALFSTIETVIIAIFAYYFLIWSTFVDLLISMPELILLPLIGNFILGKFSGLRLTEYFRFRMLLKENIEE